jgi:hypothetical protein
MQQEYNRLWRQTQEHIPYPPTDSDPFIGSLWQRPDFPDGTKQARVICRGYSQNKGQTTPAVFIDVDGKYEVYYLPWFLTGWEQVETADKEG